MTELQLPRDSRTNAVQRKDPMVRVKIKCRTHNQVIPGGFVLPLGESVCTVYKPDLATVMAMVETRQADIVQAEQFFLSDVRAAVAEELNDIPDEEGKAARLIRARQEHSGSIEGKFFSLYKRSILPLESVEVLEENIPAPVQAQSMEQQSFLASTIAREVAQALAAALPGAISQVMTAMAAQQAQPANKQPAR